MQTEAQTKQRGDGTDTSPGVSSPQQNWGLCRAGPHGPGWAVCSGAGEPHVNPPGSPAPPSHQGRCRGCTEHSSGHPVAWRGQPECSRGRVPLLVAALPDAEEHTETSAQTVCQLMSLAKV